VIISTGSAAQHLLSMLSLIADIAGQPANVLSQRRQVRVFLLRVLLTSLLFACLQEPRNSTSQLLGLSIALDNPAFSTDVKVLCAAAQACKAWQEAVRDCRACNSVVVLGPGAPVHQLRSFASWFVDHMQLVRSLTSTARHSTLPDHRTPEGMSELIDSVMHEVTATRLLQSALQLSLVPAAYSTTCAAAAEPSAEPHADDAAGTRQQQQQMQHLLRLSSFSSDHLNSAAALSALPAQHLTKLELHVPAETSSPGSLPDLLARLSNLQELHLVSKSEQVPSSCLAGIAQLRQLTQLLLSGEYWAWEDMQQGLQQLFAQPLPLQRLQLNRLWEEPYSNVDKTGLDLSGLTQLVELVTDKLSKVWVLPTQLTNLHVESVDEASTLQPLRGHQQLQHLAFGVFFGDPGMNSMQALVQTVASMPALQHLDLRYQYAGDAAESALSWKQLPLRDLRIDVDDSFPPTETEMASILQGLAAAASLTKLELEAWCVADRDENDGEDEFGEPVWKHAPVAACATLAQLTGLKDLCISQYSMLPPGDALALTALTNLTRLVIDGLGAGVGSTAAAALM
jgi:hypothetical protein